MDIRTQPFRAHAEKHPLHFIRQFAHDLGDDFQVACMASAATPTDPRFARCATLAGQGCPRVRCEHVGDYANFAVHTRQRIGQWLGRDHHPITQADAFTQHLLNVERLVAGMSIFLRSTDDVVVEFEYTQRAGVFFHAQNVAGGTFAVTALQNDGIGRQTLDLDRRRRLIRYSRNHSAGRFKLGQRSGHPVVADRTAVDRQPQNQRHCAITQRVPVIAQRRLQAKARNTEAQGRVVGGIPGDFGQPFTIEKLMLSLLPCQCRWHHRRNVLSDPYHTRVRRPDH